MHLRQDSGEIAPATWLGGAVTAVTLGGVVLLAERQIGTEPAFILFWCGCALAALCLFGAGRQHFINVGASRVQPQVPILTPQPIDPQPTETQDAPAASPIAVAEDRLFVNIRPSYLIQIYRQNIAIQADALAAPFIGKWFRLSGPLGDVNARYGSLTVTLTNFPLPELVIMHFSNDWRERLSVLTRGTVLTAIGQLSKADSSSMSLSRCEIEEISGIA